MQAELEKILRSHRVVVMLGAGGVGKTTSSVALAMVAAKLGRRAAVLSIDPARRLADAMGIELGMELREVHLDQFGVAGTLHAAMIDQKAVFDNMVKKYAPSPKVEEKILDHRLYQSLTKYLGGAVEFMALAQLQDLIESDKYDIVILDTPPAQHALDFLAKPNILADFFDSAVTRILLKPFVLANRFGLGKIMTFGEKMMGGLAKIAGVKSLEMLAEFMLLMQEVLAGFNKAGEHIVETLRDERSAFLLVNAPRRDAVELSHSIAEQISEMDYSIKGIIWNRDLCQSFTVDEVTELKAKSEEKEVVADLNVLASNLADQELLFKELEKHLKVSHPDCFVVRVPEMREDIHSIGSMIDFSSKLVRIEKVDSAIQRLT